MDSYSILTPVLVHAPMDSMALVVRASTVPYLHCQTFSYLSVEFYHVTYQVSVGSVHSNVYAEVQLIHLQQLSGRLQQPRRQWHLATLCYVRMDSYSVQVHALVHARADSVVHDVNYITVQRRQYQTRSYHSVLFCPVIWKLLEEFVHSSVCVEEVQLQV